MTRQSDCRMNQRVHAASLSPMESGWLCTCSPGRPPRRRSSSSGTAARTRSRAPAPNSVTPAPSAGSRGARQATAPPDAGRFAQKRFSGSAAARRRPAQNPAASSERVHPHTLGGACLLARSAAASDLTYDVIVPTTGRPSLARLLAALDAGSGLPPRALILVDDRGVPDRDGLRAAAPAGLSARIEVLASGGRGPAAARNVGWRAARAPWVAFLDDDVVPPADWRERLQADLRAAGPGVAGSQGRIRVPRPAGRRPTDWERNVAGLEDARWATADMAFRRAALAAVGGFDERFPRAYREDADLALRLRAAGYDLARGDREVEHPVPPAPRAVSVRKQAGNADDALMAALHGRDWRVRAEAPPGRFRLHAATTALGAGALLAAATGRRRAAFALGAGWLGATVQFASARIAPGPRPPGEIATMLAPSALIPPAATAHRLSGEVRARRIAGDPARA